MSLLLRHLEAHGPLKPADLEAATRRQQQAGGSLDTALLELGLLTPGALDACLQAACGLPGAPVRLLERLPTRPWDHVPKDLLDIGWALPLAVEDGRTIVAVHPELPDAKLGQLFRQVRGFHPVVAPECCLAKIAAERSGAILAPRYALLVLDYLQALRDAAEAAAPTSAAPAVVPSPAPAAVAPVAGAASSAPDTSVPAASPVPSAPVPAASSAPTAPVPAASPVPSAPVPAASLAPAPAAPVPAASLAPDTSVPAASPVPSAPVPAASPAPSAPVPAASPIAAPSEPVSSARPVPAAEASVPAASPAPASTGRRRGDAGAPRVGAATQPAGSQPTSAQRLEAARTTLAGARERDRITEALVRAAVLVAPRVALFGVKREGLRVLAAPGSALRLSEGLVIPLPEGGLLDRAVSGQGPLHLLVEPSLSFAVGQPLGIPCVFEPVLAGGRTVLMLYVDRAGVAFDPSERQVLRELCDLARQSLEALLRLLGWVVPAAQTSPVGQAVTDRSKPAVRPHLAAPVIPVEVPEITVPPPAPITLPFRPDLRATTPAEPPAPLAPPPEPAEVAGSEDAADGERGPLAAEGLEPASGDSSSSRSRGSLRAGRGRAVITLVNPIRRDEAAAITPLPLRVEVSETTRAAVEVQAGGEASPPGDAEPDDDDARGRARRTDPGIGLPPVPVPLGPDIAPDSALVARFAALAAVTDDDDREPSAARPEGQVVADMSIESAPPAAAAPPGDGAFGRASVSAPPDSHVTPAPVDLPDWIASQEPSGIEDPVAVSMAALGPLAELHLAPPAPTLESAEPASAAEVFVAAAPATAGSVSLAEVVAPAALAAHDVLSAPSPVEPPRAASPLADAAAAGAPPSLAPQPELHADLVPPGEAPAPVEATTVSAAPVVAALSAPPSEPAPAGVDVPASPAATGTTDARDVVPADATPSPDAPDGPAAAPLAPPPNTLIPNLIAPPGVPGAGRRRRPPDPPPGPEPVLVIPKTLRRTTELTPHPMARRADPVAAAETPTLSIPTTLIGPKAGRRRGKQEPREEAAEPALNMPRLVRDAEAARPPAEPPASAPSPEQVATDMAQETAPSEHVLVDMASGAPPAPVEAAPPAPTEPAPAAAAEAPPAAAPVDDDEIDAAIEAYLHDPAGTGVGRLRALDERGLARLAARFPGPIDLANATNFPPPSAHGPLLRACVEIGPAMGPHVLPLFASARPQIRFYAAFLFQELRDPRCLRPLADLAFDADPDVRLIATRVLESYSRTHEFAAVSAGIRAELDSRDRDRQLLAVEAAGTLRDTLAVPRLVDLLAVRDKHVREAALEALCSITAKHHGYRAARWRSWYAEHGEEPRIEWVIDGLRHRDVAVRRWAADELTRITGQRIPFPADGDRRSRDLALRAWQAWWDGNRDEYLRLT